MIEHIAGVRYDDNGNPVLGERGSMLSAPSDLCVTDMLAQPSKIRNLVGRIIFGIDINPDSFREERAPRDLHPEVMAHPVRIKCIEGRAEHVKFKRGVVNDPRGAGPSLINSQGRPIGTSSSDNQNSIKRLVGKVDERFDFKTNDVVLGLKDAWICLSQHGEYCRAARGRLVNKYWLYQEVDDDGDPMIYRHDKAEKAEAANEPEKRGPGRPRKS